MKILGISIDQMLIFAGFVLAGVLIGPNVAYGESLVESGTLDSSAYTLPMFIGGLSAFVACLAMMFIMDRLCKDSVEE